MMYKFRKRCRLCSSNDFNLVLDLGKQPPSNSFLRRNELECKERKFPLRLYICKKCHHLQLLDVVDKKYLFSNYHYFTSANKPIVEHFKKYSDQLYKQNLKKRKKPFVVEIGSNDGTLLKQLVRKKINVLGVEPAKNLADISRKKGIKTKNDFFNVKVAKTILKTGKPDMIIANNVLGHIDDLDEFMKSIHILLKDDGVFVFEVPHALELIKKLEFDTIYHEHISYFSIIPLQKWFKKNNFEIFDLRKQKVHGGTLRIFVSRINNFKIKKSVKNMISFEKKFGMQKLSTYNKFSKKVLKLKKILRSKIINLKNQDEILFGYGAPAKGNVLLNFCEINNKILDFVTDTTKLKQGKFTPGTKIKIVNPKQIMNKKKKMTGLLLAWNYKTAIIKNEEKFLKNGGKFLIPIPIPKIVSK